MALTVSTVNNNQNTEVHAEEGHVALSIYDHDKWAVLTVEFTPADVDNLVKHLKDKADTARKFTMFSVGDKIHRTEDFESLPIGSAIEHDGRLIIAKRQSKWVYQNNENIWYYDLATPINPATIVFIAGKES